MEADALRDLVRTFDCIEDPRMNRTLDHSLENILTIALVGILAGLETWTGIERFGKAKADWFARILDLPNGIPSHDTFGRVFARLDPAQVNACFAQWVEHLAARVGGCGGHIAIDGKAVRGSAEPSKGKAPIHMVNAWANEARLVVGQLACDQKSNEIPAVRELLKLLDIEGCVVTLDAMHTQAETAQQILDQGGDYVMVVKANQPKLLEDVMLQLAEAEGAFGGFPGLDQYVTEDDGHGRIEVRQYTTLTLSRKTWRLASQNRKPRWPGLKAIGRVVRERTDKSTGKTSTQTVYYLISRPMDIRQFSDAVRGHWGIENQVHWQLDVTFNEDGCRCRKDHSAENLAILRRLTLNLVEIYRGRLPKNKKISRDGIRQQIAWDLDYIKKLLIPMGEI